MKFLVTGISGQLGFETCRQLQLQKQNVIGISRKEIDFNHPEQVSERIAEKQADWVINCAAYTQVDKAEQNREQAFRVNHDSAAAIAEGVQSYGGRLLHVSTDYVFDGLQSRPYLPEDRPNPLGVYGQSKLEGEQAIQAILPEALIVRTAWVYGAHGHNFVKTILKLLGERDELSVVDDQIGTPSWTTDISRALLTLINKESQGTFHFTNEGITSWYDFAVAIRDQAKKLGFSVKTGHIKPIPSKNYPTPAARPTFTVLNKEKTRAALGYDIPHWQHSLAAMLLELKENQELART